MKQYGYNRKEKLKKRKDLERLFKQGTWKSSQHMRVVFRSDSEIEGMKIGVSVSKKNFKRAVDRNRIKRLLRESYRLNKALFHQRWGQDVHAMFFWSSNKMPQSSHQVVEEMLRLLMMV